MLGLRLNHNLYRLTLLLDTELNNSYHLQCHWIMIMTIQHYTNIEMFKCGDASNGIIVKLLCNSCVHCSVMIARLWSLQGFTTSCIILSLVYVPPIGRCSGCYGNTIQVNELNLQKNCSYCDNFDVAIICGLQFWIGKIRSNYGIKIKGQYGSKIGTSKSNAD